MNLNIVKMEVRRLRKMLIIGLVAPTAYTSLVMVFYIAFAEVLSDMQTIFNNVNMQSILRAFNMSSDTFLYILSYYVSYNGVYMLIMGIIFAAVLAARLFSRELTDGTYEFIYAVPISRLEVFISKSIVIVLYLVVLNLFVFLTGFITLEALQSNSPLVAWVDEANVEMVNDHVTKENIEVFDRDDGLFYEVIFSDLSATFNIEQTSDVDPEIASELMTVFLKSPDDVFDVLLENPEKYAELVGGNEKLLIQLVEVQKKNYFDQKEKFFNDTSFVLDAFRENPKPFLNQIIQNDQINEFQDAFGLKAHEIDRLFIHYSFDNFVKVSYVAFLVMLAMAMFVMMLTIVVPNGKITSGVASSICLGFYMLNIIGNIAPTDIVTYISPLSYINNDVMNVSYHHEPWQMYVLITMIVGSYIVSAIRIRKMDLIA